MALGAAQYGYFEPSGRAGADAKPVLEEVAEGAGGAGFVVAGAGGARRAASDAGAVQMNELVATLADASSLLYYVGRLATLHALPSAVALLAVLLTRNAVSTAQVVSRMATFHAHAVLEDQGRFARRALPQILAAGTPLTATFARVSLLEPPLHAPSHAYGALQHGAPGAARALSVALSVTRGARRVAGHRLANRAAVVLQVNSGGVARATGALALEALRNSPDALASFARPPRPLVPVPVHQTVAKATVDVNGNASRAARSRHEGLVPVTSHRSALQVPACDYSVPAHFSLASVARPHLVVVAPLASRITATCV